MDFKKFFLLKWLDFCWFWLLQLVLLSISPITLYPGDYENILVLGTFCFSFVA